MMTWCGLTGPLSALVIGARGGIGAAFVDQLCQCSEVDQVFALSRDKTWVSQTPESDKIKRRYAEISDEESLSIIAEEIKALGTSLRFVINCSGLLHDDTVQPERTWRHFDLETMRKVFEVNTFGVALLIKHFVPLIPRNLDSLFASLSARVGSITDNRIGGWYSYRASKAAQNMIIKTAAIEASRTRPRLTLVALHPGTVDTSLSEPFTKRLAKHHDVFSPQHSCQLLCKVLEKLTPIASGQHLAWDGSEILG